ncbi:hypothetical protein TRAPUB_9046 [Trametes pubescens]|uniref:Uncharacterized protein n=1 Tax=Trametes pubescens TaxID=154538 RepID=A0A1M2W3H1_TRAPU|nr:hypothetical protein TRAPUB_9046 [Trametes pubescens]
MAPEIRFNALGIPYLVEFANVAFRSHSRSSSRSSMRPPTPRRDASESRPSLNLRPTPSRSTLASDWTLAATASSETLAGPGAEAECPEDHGLYIRLASQLAQPPCRLSESRLARLKYRIAKAVLAAGMDSSPGAERGDPLDAAGRGRMSISSIRSENVERDGVPGSLFRGTYGQVMTALRAAGLATVPCKESGVQDATRLGALFVAHPNERGGVEFTKLTLWA